MRGRMAGLVGDDKENTPVPGEGKKRRSSGTGSLRRLSIGGSKSHLHYLRTIANRFKRKAGAGRGRILVHRPLCLDGSPFEFDSRSDGEKRKSFVVFEDGVDSGCSKSNDITTELEITGKAPPTARFKNGKLKALKPQVSEGQTASRESVQQDSKYHSLKSLPAFRARAKAVFAATSRPLPVAASVEAANQEDSGSGSSVECQSRRLPRGGTGNVYAHCSLDKSELDDIEQLFKKMDEEDLQEELYRHALEREMHEHDLTNEMQEIDQREHEQNFVSAEVNEVPETVKIRMEEETNICAPAREPFESQDVRLLSPMISGLDPEGGIASVDLSTPQLQLDQEESIPLPTPVIVELGDSPEPGDFDRAIKQLTPPVRLPFSGCNDKDLSSLQQIPREAEPRHAQDVNAAQVWSVELDPSRRRRDAMEEYKYFCTPWSERLTDSSLRAANQLPGSSSDVFRNFDMPPSSLNFSQLDTNGPAKNLVEAYEGEFRSTNLSTSAEKDHGERIGCESSHRPDPATINEDEMHAAMILNEREMQTWKGSKATLRRSWSYWPDQSPIRPVDLSADCVGNIHENPSESSLESPSLQATELLRRVESAIATTPLGKVSFDSIRMSPTPPKDICFYLGISEEELTRRWLQFCASSSVFSDFKAKREKLWKVESPFAELTCSDPTTRFPSEQVLQRTLKDLFTISGEEAVSSDGQDWKTSAHNEEVLLNAEEEGVSSDGLDCKTSAHNEEVLLNAEGEAVSSDGLDCKASAHNEEVLPNAEEEGASSDGLDCKASAHNEEVLPNAEEVALSSDGSDGDMDYENDHDDISNDTTQIIQTGASSAYNDQEALSALKECQQENEPLGDDTENLFDLLPLDLTPLKDLNPAVTMSDPAVEYSLTNLDKEHIDQFMSSLQVTPTVDEPCVGRPSINGEEVSKVSYDVHTPSGKAEHLSVINELVTPAKDASRYSPEAQVECTPVQKQTKTNRPRKSRKTKKVDSPLDAGSKWSNGKRQSTRIRSKPLDWWRGERMLYGRVHSTLNTLIGIKHLSPDPVWPRPRTGDRKNKVGPQKFKVDSFVSDEHNELLRLAAQ